MRNGSNPVLDLAQEVATVRGNHEKLVKHLAEIKQGVLHREQEMSKQWEKAEKREARLVKALEFYAKPKGHNLYAYGHEAREALKEK